ncbi:MAG: MBL fold metallo-hydrolase [Lentisphaeraceae bacterium]|nr:MBL fold metallo-hydrolase [Lentisphaeraceae bacterium]
MEVTFWGVRGSIASPGPETAKYGGNTSCYEVRNDAGDLVIMDAGTGIRKLGMKLMQSLPLKCSILISHTHWDHIQGFPFFIPAFVPGNNIDMYSPKQFEKSLEGVISSQMDYSVFPVRTAELSADIKFHNIIEGPVEGIPGFEVFSQFVCHPVTSSGYRVEADGKAVFYTGDHEKYFDQYHKGIKEEDIDPEVKAQMQAIVDVQNDRVIASCKDVDLLIVDTMYMDDEYSDKIGWGHSTVEMGLELGVAANVKHLALSHHDPTKSDDRLDEILKYARKKLDDMGGKHIELSIAQEGKTIKL